MLFLNKNTNFNKNGIKNATHALALLRKSLCFSSYKNRKLEEKEKKSAFFVTFILSEVNLF